MSEDVKRLLRTMAIDTQLSQYIVRDGIKIPKERQIVAVVDGTSFTKEIKPQFQQPFDPEFDKIMYETATGLLQNGNPGRFAYVKSDEIVLLLTPETEYYERKSSEIAQRLAARTTRQFIETSEKLGKRLLAEFHTTICAVPTTDAVESIFIERQLDYLICQINAYAGHHNIRGKRQEVMDELDRIYNGAGWRNYGALVYRTAIELTGEDPRTKTETSTTRTKVVWTSEIGLFRDKRPDLIKLIRTKGTKEKDLALRDAQTPVEARIQEAH
ncbi:MAG: tRNA(His) guanylyltransferase Thg1 family protein [Candidatus Woesearchaeota archaeon]|nr:tRNA(His) guanylyltransferase Thg1 family protein [Candidatus Woesearchaeota archaeon]